MRALLAEVAGLRFALPLAVVRKVLPAVQITPVPNVSGAVEGVVDVRGEVYAVVSVERALGLGPGSLAADHHFVLAMLGRLPVALHVDRVLEVVDLDEKDLIPMSDVLPGRPSAAGVARSGGELVVVHDLASFLSLSDGRAMEQTLGVGAEETSP